MARRQSSGKTSASHDQDFGVRIEQLARNLWWTWNPDARRLFAGLEPALWEATGRNPIATVRRLTPERLAAIESDAGFAELLTDCEQQLRRYLGTRTWFARTFRGGDRRLLAAYFCAEYAIDDCLPLYSGGLGVLAGDHLKSASDLGVPLVAVGLLYRSGYYRQQFGPDGSTRIAYPRYDFGEWPIAATGLAVDVQIAKRRVWAKIWKATVGRVSLYLLDTDIRENLARDRAITTHLYGGDQDTRIQQEIVLGVGGVAALEALGIKPSVFHLNEGHAAFSSLERLRRMRTAGAAAQNALSAVSASTVFTTHTPVPAGHDRFSPSMMKKYLGPSMKAIGQASRAPDPWMNLGREDLENRKEDFCMTVLALGTSDHCNGVSKLHGAVSRRMWMRPFGAAKPDDVNIGHVTNGIHPQTWLAPEIAQLYARFLKPDWNSASPDGGVWKDADGIPPAELWHMRNRLRRKLVHYVRAKLREQTLRNAGPVDQATAACEAFDENTLTIGFARRFATYKRAPLIFQDARRLTAILNDPKRPVQLVFAGKAHPRDLGGQEYARTVYEMTGKPDLRGRVVLLENYDMQMGQMLTSGCDVWLNNPIRPQEASGTSGMKPPLHGGINCSILDGWWPEAYDGRNGWAIGGREDMPTQGRRQSAPEESKLRKLKTQAAQDRHDAECIYRLLEKQIVPLFYARGRDGVPAGWMRMALRSMKTVCGMFNTHRMVGEYVERYYLPAHR